MGAKKTLPKDKDLEKVWFTIEDSWLFKSLQILISVFCYVKKTIEIQL